MKNYMNSILEIRSGAFYLFQRTNAAASDSNRPIRWFGAVLLGLMLILASACQSAPQRANRYSQNGHRYFDQQKYQEASINFQKSLQNDPRAWEPRYYLALSEAKLGQNQEAYRNLSVVVELQPSFAPAQLELTELLLLAGKPVEARKQIESVQARDVGNARAQALLARSYLLEKDFGRAASECEKAKQIAPKQDTVWALCGLAEVGGKQYASAEQDFLRAIELNPDNSEHYRNLANLYRITQHSGKIEPLLRQAADAHPKSLDFSLVLAESYFLEGRFNDIDVLFGQLKSRAHEFSNLRLQLGDFWMWRNEPRRAAAEFESEPTKSVLLEKKLISAYLSLGRAPEAEKLNAALLKNDPRDLDGRTFEGALAFLNNDFGTATEKLQAVLKEEPSSLMADYYLGLSWMALGQWERAKSAFFDCLRINDKFVYGYLRLGELALKTNAPKDALVYANEATQLAPGTVDPYLVMTQAYLANGDLQHAQAIIDVAERMPEAPAQFNELAAQFYTLRKDEIAATTQYEKALARTNQPFETLVRYADFLVAHGRAAAAVARVKQWMETVSPQAYHYELLANLYLQQRDFENAKAACEKALQLDPQRWNAHFWLAESLRQAGHPDEALKHYDAAIRLGPDAIPAYIVAGKLLQEQEQLEKAKSYFEMALRRDPNSTTAQYSLARWYADSNQNLDVALGMAQELKRNLPQDQHVADLLGWIYCKKGVYRSALEQLQPAAKAIPDDPIVQYHLGITYLQVGYKDKAKNALTSALKRGLVPRSLASDAEQKLKRLTTS